MLKRLILDVNCKSYAKLSTIHHRNKTTKIRFFNIENILINKIVVILEKSLNASSTDLIRSER